MRRALLLTATAVVALGTSLTATAAAGTTPTSRSALAGTTQMKLPGGFKHLVVIYLENHSFDNLYGGWGSVNGQPVDGLGAATGVQSQVAQDGTTFSCLLQNDVNLTSPTPLASTCTDNHTVYNTTNPPGVGTVKSVGFESHFLNQPFRIDDYIGPNATTCPMPPTYSTPIDGNGIRDGSGEREAAAHGISCTASTRSSTRSTVASRTAT